MTIVVLASVDVASVVSDALLVAFPRPAVPVIVTAVPSLPFEDSAVLPRFSARVWLKLHCWNLTAFHRVVYLDADSIVLGDVTHLFTSLPLPSRQHVASVRIPTVNSTQSGLLVIQPQEQVGGGPPPLCPDLRRCVHGAEPPPLCARCQPRCVRCVRGLLRHRAQCTLRCVRCVRTARRLRGLLRLRTSSCFQLPDNARCGVFDCVTLNVVVFSIA